MDENQENNINPEQNPMETPINQDQDQATQQPNEIKPDEKTIMPTMVDTEEDEKAEKKVDISAIIPQSVQNNNKEDGIKIESKDALLKSDGSVVLGVVQGEGIAMQENAQMPEPIDIEERRKEAKALREGKIKHKKKRDISKAKKEMKTLNKKTFIALFMIALLAGALIYIKNSPRVNDFQPINVHVELGDQLPLHSVSYVTPAIGQKVDDLTYKIDTSNVIIDKVGEYQFTVSHNGITKIGLLVVEDTTAPKFEIKDLTITEGTEYAATDFVKSCEDYSGCNYDFEEKGIEEQYVEPGSYTLFVTATDAYGNKSEKQANLIIEDRGKVKYYTKTEDFPELGYKLTTRYEIHFSDVFSTSIIVNGIKTTIYEYYYETDYEAARQEQYGMENTTVDDDKYTITKTEKANKIGDNERFEYVTSYLETNGYRETDKNWK